MHTGMSVLDAALNLSLDSLEDCTGQETSLATPYMLREMYISLCVLQNQQRALVSVLCRMWNNEECMALEICVRFSSLSLAKMSHSSAGHGKEEYILRIHDLHLEYVRRMAGETCAEWHRRLLIGHIASDISAVAGTAASIGDNLVISTLEYTPRA